MTGIRTEQLSKNSHSCFVPRRVGGAHPPAFNDGWTYGDVVPPHHAGTTLLDYYTQNYQHSNRATWQQRIESGQILLNNQLATPITLLKPGQKLTYHRSPWQEPGVPLEIEIIYEDAELLAVHKPSGLPVLPGGNFLQHTLLWQLRQGYRTAAPIHRLGRGTSGIMLIAKTKAARAHLSQQMRQRTLTKTYRALIGSADALQDQFTITQPIGKIPYPQLGYIYGANPDGLDAQSNCSVISRSSTATLLDVTILTGRPHQIRIHLASIGYPLLGDPLYMPGGHPHAASTAIPSDCGYWLHAHQLSFTHPTTGQPLTLSCESPGELSPRQAKRVHRLHSTVTINIGPISRPDAMTTSTSRIEKDSMGEKAIPSAAYYGIQTLRAVENFPISGLKPLPTYVDACLLIKKAAAIANGELDCIPTDLSQAIVSAADEVLKGSLRDQFIVDVYQAGAGTSHHMNINEVLANRALELLGDEKGNYKRVSPNDHVNYGQSTNDVIPTAIRVGGLLALEHTLYPALEGAIATLHTKAAEFQDIVRSGRTHMQDAVPIRLGESFRAWEVILTDHLRRLRTAAQDLCVLGLGGSATGTGLNTHPNYRHRVAELLARFTGQPLTSAPHLMAAMQSMAPFVAVSSNLRNIAQDLVKISHDLRLLDSGPKTGLKEIQLPPVQPGSSIMPGKYNPVMAEMTSMVCFQVMGYDQAIACAAQAGQLELNVMMPLIAYDLIHSIEILGNTINALDQRCLTGITARRDRCRDFAEGSLALVTALNTHIGYLNAADIAKESLETGKSMRQLVLEKNLMPEDKLNEVLDLEKMSSIPE